VIPDQPPSHPSTFHPVGAPTREEVLLGFMSEVVAGDVGTTVTVSAPAGTAVFPVGLRIFTAHGFFVIDEVRMDGYADQSPLLAGPVDASIYAVPDARALPVGGGMPDHVHGVPYVEVKGWPVLSPAHPVCFRVRRRRSVHVVAKDSAPLFEGYIVGIPAHYPPNYAAPGVAR